MPIKNIWTRSMNIRCWRCTEEIDAFSVEKQVYQSLIDKLRDRLCANAKNDRCELWWKHEDCHIFSSLIQELKGKI